MFIIDQHLDNVEFNWVFCIAYVFSDDSYLGF